MDYFSHFHVNVSSLLPGVHHYLLSLDIDYMRWVLWLIYPIIISFLLPLIIVVLLLASILFLHVYSYRQRLRKAYAQDFWQGARQTLAVLWDGQGYIWHDYEVEGFSNVPSSGPALLIYYHGAIPIDVYYVMAKCIIDKGRTIRAVGDRFLFKVPGLRILMDVFKVTPGTVQSCINLLKQGHILAIAPGGVREALFGDEEYQIMWSKRIGFAKVALLANVSGGFLSELISDSKPVIPMFTQNVREAFRTPSWCRSVLRRLYEKIRLPIVPIYGGFPVKLKTIFGEPIYPDPSSSPEEFADQVRNELQKLISKHQQVPGSVFRGFLERIYRTKSAEPKSS